MEKYGNVYNEVENKVRGVIDLARHADAPCIAMSTKIFGETLNPSVHFSWLGMPTQILATASQSSNEVRKLSTTTINSSQQPLSPKSQPWRPS